jgi:hypothetical protein
MTATRQRITVSDHAVERYIERIRDLDQIAARVQLEQLLDGASVRADPPPGLRAEEQADAWAWITEDGAIVAPLMGHRGGLHAVSVYAKGGLSEVARARRTREKQYRRASKSFSKRIKHPGRPRPEPTGDEW